MGLLFWRKKREPRAIAEEALPGYGSAPESVGETTTGVDETLEPEVLRDAPAEALPVEPEQEKGPQPEQPSAPEVVVEVTPEPESVSEFEQSPLAADTLRDAAAEASPDAPDSEPAPQAALEEPELEAVELPKRSFGKNLKSLFTRIKFDVENLDDLEDTLIQADFGLEVAELIVEGVKQRAKKQGARTEEELKQILISLIVEQLKRDDSALNLQDGKLPYVILVVGVNGVGKTTTIGKLANWLTEGNWRVVIGAADTFRAAAVEQIATWAERANAKLIRPKAEGQDPASVAFETVELALRDDADIAIIDTAGRLQNKKDLMAELEKIKRVVEKNAQISETLLVIDATTGQNGLAQAKAFAEVANVTGIVLTKLDGTAKGGIVFAIQRELGIPVKLVGVGEGIKDFAFFDPEEFAKGLVG